MKVVAFVPIKLDSQRLPHKNILPIAGHPLCWHIVNSLLQVERIDEVYVYCSDPAVCKYLPDGARFLRRSESLDGDLVKGFEIYESFIREVDAQIYILAHTTSPFLQASSIANALEHVLQGENDSAFSAERIQTFAWYKNEPVNYNLNDVPRTQDMEPVWVETSGFYMFQKEIFTEHRRRIGFRPYIQEVSGMEAVDIDEQQDYDMAVRMVE
ncbi:MAG: acylneuraminate cytidylyltransferase family protein [Blautia sp.]|nr:acylneuraminate cytidylyltransferase family protein [Blautia sp.]MCM1237261.1 acylneuraminate cytidylyltransferase family protein [Ruminococcus flavefaciens]